MLDFTFLLWEGVIITGIIFLVIQKIRHSYWECAVKNLCPICKGAGKFIFGNFLHKYGGQPEEIKEMDCGACAGKGDYYTAQYRASIKADANAHYKDEYARIWRLHLENKFHHKLSAIKIRKINAKKEDICKRRVSMK